MKFHEFLGVNTKTNRVCILNCLCDFDELNKENSKVNGNIKSEYFIHRSTNWAGRDDMDRTLKIEGIKPTGRKINLAKPITFEGSDYDCGHNYSWRFTINQIWEVEK